jgi:hypothetical protein
VVKVRKISNDQLARLGRVAMTEEGLPVQRYRMGRYVGLLRAGLVRRGPMPPRNAGGRLCYPQRLFVTDAGRDLLLSVFPELELPYQCCRMTRGT